MFLRHQSIWNSLKMYVWTLIKRFEKKLDGNCTRMQRAILNKSWKQHPTNQQLNGHLPSISKTIQFRQTRLAGHCWRSNDELISDVLLWNPSHRSADARRPARTYLQQLCMGTGCCLEDLPNAMDDRDDWRERRERGGQGNPCSRQVVIIYIHIYIYIYIVMF